MGGGHAAGARQKGNPSFKGLSLSLSPPPRRRDSSSPPSHCLSSKTHDPRGVSSPLSPLRGPPLRLPRSTRPGNTVSIASSLLFSLSLRVILFAAPVAVLPCPAAAAALRLLSPVSVSPFLFRRLPSSLVASSVPPIKAPIGVPEVEGPLHVELLLNT